MDDGTLLGELRGLPWGWIALVVVLGLWVLGAYNRIIALRGSLSAAWQQFDVVLRQRQQAIGALMEQISESMPGERAALDAVVAGQVQVATAAEVLARKPGSADTAAVMARAEGALAAALSRLVALIEHHPELMAQDEVRAPLATLGEVKPALDFTRKRFNEDAERYNAAIEQFPTRLLNQLFRFERAGTL